MICCKKSINQRYEATDDRLNLLDYKTIKGAVVGEQWATAQILKHYDDYMTELATVKER